MTKGYVLTIQPLLFGGYVHGPQVPHSFKGPRSACLGLLFMGGKRSKTVKAKNKPNGKKS